MKLRQERQELELKAAIDESEIRKRVYVQIEGNCESLVSRYDDLNPGAPLFMPNLNNIQSDREAKSQTKLIEVICISNQCSS